MNKKPILNDHDKKHVLSAKKKQKVILKNLLVQPFERYWPELSPADVDHFVQKFRVLHKSSSGDNEKAPSTTKTSTSPENVPKNERIVNKVTLGLRSSIRCVSSGKTLALFISSKIRPKYILDQIITMTVTKNPNSRIFCVPDLDVALLDVLGFSCQCLAVLEDENDIWNWSVGKSKQFPLPKSFNKLTPATINEPMEIETTDKRAVVPSETKEVDISTLHLRKENTNQRAFVPHGTVRENQTGNEFISLGEANLKIDNIRPTHQMISKIQKTEMSNASKASSMHRNFVRSDKFSMKKTLMPKQKNHQFNKVNYLPLKVNRVQSNTEKIRNKNKKKRKNNKK